MYHSRPLKADDLRNGTGYARDQPLPTSMSCARSWRRGGLSSGRPEHRYSGITDHDRRAELLPRETYGGVIFTGKHRGVAHVSRLTLSKRFPDEYERLIWWNVPSDIPRHQARRSHRAEHRLDFTDVQWA